MAEHYQDDGRAGDFLVDLLKLEVPRLFAMEGGEKEDEAVGRKFSHFLQGYISRCAVKHTILEKMSEVMVREANRHLSLYANEYDTNNLQQEVKCFHPISRPRV